MSNYVHNYVFCNKELYNDFLNNDFEHRLFESGIYDPISSRIGSDRYLVIFDSCGMDYKTDLIRRIIDEYHDVVWNCVEENRIEEGQFRWDGERVVSSVRHIQESVQGCIFEIDYEDPNFKLLKSIMGFPQRIIEENCVTNKHREFVISYDATNRLKQYMNNMKIRILNDSAFQGYASSIQGVVLDEYVFWGYSDRDYAEISKMESGEVSQNLFDKGDRTIKFVKAFLDVFFKDNKIDISLTARKLKDFVL